MTTDAEAGNDLTTLLEELFNKNENLQKSPLYIVAESYGGKFAVTLALAAVKAIEAGKLKLKLGGNLFSSSFSLISNIKNLKIYLRKVEKENRDGSFSLCPGYQ